MKILALVLMVLTILVIVGFGFAYLLGFVMSFDAPGSDKDPDAWSFRILMLGPIVIFLRCLSCPSAPTQPASTSAPS